MTSFLALDIQILGFGTERWALGAKLCSDRRKEVQRFLLLRIIEVEVVVGKSRPFVMKMVVPDIFNDGRACSGQSTVSSASGSHT